MRASPGRVGCYVHCAHRRPLAVIPTRKEPADHPRKRAMADGILNLCPSKETALVYNLFSKGISARLR